MLNIKLAFTKQHYALLCKARLHCLVRLTQQTSPELHRSVSTPYKLDFNVVIDILFEMGFCQ